MTKTIKLLATCAIGVLIAVGTITLFALPRSFSQDVMPLAVTLANGGFEEPYNEQGSSERQTADQWSLWFYTGWTGEAYLHEPKAGASSNTRPNSTGSASQNVRTRDPASNFDACVYQQVSGITVGHWIRFSAWVRVDMPSNFAISDAQTRIGVDPDGGTNPLDIQYETHQTNWDVYDANHGEWQELSIGIPATSPTATVYACAHPSWPMDFNVYFDDAEIEMTPDQLVYLPKVSQRLCVIAPGELYNPDLEKEFCLLNDYQPHAGYSGAIAPYWNPWVITTGYKIMHPEFNKTDRDYRKYSGEVAQQFGHSAWGLFKAGIYQVVTGTNPGEVLQFTIYGWGWIGKDGNTNDRVSDYTGADGLLMRVGIDPTGGEDKDSSNIVWSDFHSDPLDKWNQYQVTATAVMTRASVWVYAQGNKYGMRYHQTFWDKADLIVMGSAP